MYLKSSKPRRTASSLILLLANVGVNFSKPSKMLELSLHLYYLAITAGYFSPQLPKSTFDPFLTSHISFEHCGAKRKQINQGIIIFFVTASATHIHCRHIKLADKMTSKIKCRHLIYVVFFEHGK